MFPASSLPNSLALSQRLFSFAGYVQDEGVGSDARSLLTSRQLSAPADSVIEPAVTDPASALVLLILTFGPISGAHFHPAVQPLVPSPICPVLDNHSASGHPHPPRLHKPIETTLLPAHITGTAIAPPALGWEDSKWPH
jgi:hypothetical protein